MESPAAVKPDPHFCMFVRALIVQDHVDGFARRDAALDLVHKLDELLMTMALHVLPDNFACQHIQCCEKGRRAVSFIIVRHGLRATLFQRQTSGVDFMGLLPNSFFSEAKKLSMGSLSRRCPLRLVDFVISVCLISLRYLVPAYWLLRSKWWINPDTGPLRLIPAADEFDSSAGTNLPLRASEKRFIRLISKRRSRVEQCFGTMKRLFGLHRARYFGVANTHRVGVSRVL